MNKNLSQNQIKKIPVYILMLPALLIFSSCARSIAFNSSVVVPAAQGKVTLKTDRNKNYAIQVRVKNLAEPANLHPSKATYIVWMESAVHGTKNLGQLRTKTGLFGGALKASLNTTTSFEPRKFFITGEDNPTVERPRYQRVLETDDIIR